MAITNTWQPCTRIADLEKFQSLKIKSAKGSYITLSNGQNLIDATASWWCKSLGHAHPAIKAALIEQTNHFEHIMMSNTSNDQINLLSKRLCNLMPHLEKVFYASDGACAVEIALKMSLHARINQGNNKRKNFISLNNSYHGETVGALSVSNIDYFKKPYTSLLFNTTFIEPAYVNSMHDPLWKDASFHWHKIKKQLDAIATTTTAIIIEPIVQGAGCMKIYSANFLKRLADWAKKHDIHIIADEIMTGLGRTGKMLASEHANIQPDFICLSKALTAGWLPLSAVLTTHKIFNTFYEDDTSGKTFFHSHTFSGNALAVSTALATLEIIEKEKLNQRANTLQKTMMQHLLDINQKTGKLKNLRGIGAIVAADLTQHPTKNRIGYDLFKEAVKLGALIRPIGNTLYWLPPLNIKTKTLETLKEVTLNAINNIY